MQLLLDTHSLIWFFSGHPSLSDRSRQLMEDTTYQKLISLASVWEMGIKQSKGKLSLPLPLAEYIKEKTALDNRGMNGGDIKWNVQSVNQLISVKMVIRKANRIISV